MVADTSAYTACSAFNLIALIAVEPVIAHYIQEALDALLCDLAARKGDQVPALEKTLQSCPRDADSLYKKQCETLAAETEKAGIL